MGSVFKIYTLFSGSGGNCTFIKAKDTAILIDAGKSAGALCKALNSIGESIENVSAIFITHEHIDHIAGLEMLSKKYHVPIHITEASAACFDQKPNAYVHSVLQRHTPIYSEQIGQLSVNSFVTSHDSRMSVGYRVEIEEGGEKHSFGLATDLGYVSDAVREGLCGCEAVVIESNHDENMLMEGPYPRVLKQRIASRTGHISNKACAELAEYLAKQGTKAFMLAHLSKENNEPHLAYETVSCALLGYGVNLFVASPDVPTELILPIQEDTTNVECKAYNTRNA